ncbi:hypothetical protein KFL_007140010 [Klebsormidium nitens]|uniref:Uncharacterized protein n=1 Tax=Klebsormidium nitens TaxID=105231 RepID=A0A1Y1IS78_KLENI|nr:hypothetical protein KFL_007140010 [Klebsormidium nitens]|eukprot:GAQ91018.1 hypothetical protein KFL_007140010 [Klebsormidium nitens]
MASTALAGAYSRSLVLTSLPSVAGQSVGQSFPAPVARPCLIEAMRKKKATKHHEHSRPKKHNPYDKNRKPPVYDALPPRPPVLVAESDSEAVQQAQTLISGAHETLRTTIA